jgi:TrmH family RNA methyltransferase
VEEVLVAKEDELAKVSALSTPQEVLAVASIPVDEISLNDFSGKLTVLLDDVRDPGNLGTILRIAHWFGAAQVITSLNSVDAYHPKVVQASMGSLFHVPVHAVGLEGLLTQVRSETKLPIYATLLGGVDLYSAPLTKEGLVIFGNESMGIRTSLQELSDVKLTIPSHELFAGSKPESLNVGISVALVLAEFRRR